MKMVSILIAGLLAGLPPDVLAGTVEGIAFSEAGPVQNATINAYRSYEELVADQVFRASETGKLAGQYHLSLPPGSYYLVARGTLDERHLFAYHGVNPIVIGDDYRWLPFLMTPENQATCEESQGQSRLAGLVTYLGHPVAGGVVSVYPWRDGKFRGMGLLTNTLDENGAFSFGMEAGTYVVIARKKQDIRGIGPVQQGDMFCYPSTNPISIANNQTCTTEISCYPRDALDLFLNSEAVNPQGRRHESRRQASLHDLQPAAAQEPPGERATTSISGRVTDPNGKALAGLMVTAYPANGLELFQMQILRLITGNMARTDSDGRYQIELKDGEGKYYLAAREKVGEAPDRLEYYGLYEGNPNHSVTIKPGGNLSEINLVADRIMPNKNPDGDHAKP